MGKLDLCTLSGNALDSYGFGLRVGVLPPPWRRRHIPHLVPVDPQKATRACGRRKQDRFVGYLTGGDKALRALCRVVQ